MPTEGKTPNSIILQFPGMEQARAWHESAACQAIIADRLASEPKAISVWLKASHWPFEHY